MIEMEIPIAIADEIAAGAEFLPTASTARMRVICYAELRPIFGKLWR
jgi:hypothetical protein